MRAKKTNIVKIEKGLSFWNEIGPGVGLLVGYVFFFLYQLMTPMTVVNIDVATPVYKGVQIGFIPSNGNGKLNDTEILQSDNISLDQPVIIDSAYFEKGIPQLIHKQVSIRGYGKAEITSSQIEIVQPVLATPSYKAVFFSTGVRYIPNVYYKGTGVFYEKKQVNFPDALNADSMSIRTGAFFAFISLILFFIKSRHQMKAYWIAFKNIKVISGGRH